MSHSNPVPEQTLLDLLIIGAGPIGISAAIAAQKEGLNYLVIEKGCLTNSLYNYPLDMQFFSSAEKLELYDIPFNTTQPKPRRKEALEYYRRMATHFKLQIRLFETVLSVENLSNKKTPKATLFKINTSKASYSAKNIVVATGFFDIPSLLNVAGEALPKVSHYFKDAHFYCGQKIAIIGASNSAIDAALACYRKGAEVSLIIRGKEVGPRVKYWVRPDILNRIEEGSITVYYHAQVQEITPSHLFFTKQGETLKIANDFVLALTGYKPNLPFLSALGVTLEGDAKIPMHNKDTMETNIHGVFLAGVICGGLETHKWFIENSRDHAQRIATYISKKN